MKLKFFSINALEPEPDQIAVDDFCTRHRIISVDKRFIEREDVCFWSICVTYLQKSSSPSKPTQSVNKRGQIDYREVLNEADFTVYAKLRDLRKEISETESIPVYAIFSNAQMAEMVTSRVIAKTTLSKINGVGDAKLENYAERFLELLKAEYAGSDTNSDAKSGTKPDTFQQKKNET